MKKNVVGIFCPWPSQRENIPTPLTTSLTFHQDRSTVPLFVSFRPSRDGYYPPLETRNEFCVVPPPCGARENVFLFDSDLLTQLVGPADSPLPFLRLTACGSGERRRDPATPPLAFLLNWGRGFHSGARGGRQGPPRPGPLPALPAARRSQPKVL